MKRIKEWFIKNKEDILLAWGMAGALSTMLLLVFCLVTMTISEDLVGVVNTKEQEIAKKDTMIEALEYERNYYYYLTDELQQTYEDVVPKGQYIQDVEFLESVILELRGQCEIELNKKCECQ